MNKERKKCPYCSRKINYGRRLLENSKGEHTCKHCKKNSNIKQNSLIWIILFICCLFAVFIMVFYFSSAKNIQDAYDDTGKYKFWVTIFFGKFKEIKWILWEILPFVVFYFVSPIFIEFSPQKKFMEQTQSSIDLSVPLGNTASNSKSKADQKSKSLKKQKETEFSGVYEDISSSSSDIGQTRAFDFNDATDYYKDEKEETFESMTDINIIQKNSTSHSYSSDVPLVKVSHTPPVYKDEDIKEYIPTKERIQEQAKTPTKEKPVPPANYSANRKF